jgi:hypothetical protein
MRQNVDSHKIAEALESTSTLMRRLAMELFVASNRRRPHQLQTV